MHSRARGIFTILKPSRSLKVCLFVFYFHKPPRIWLPLRVYQSTTNLFHLTYALVKIKFIKLQTLVSSSNLLQKKGCGTIKLFTYVWICPKEKRKAWLVINIILIRKQPGEILYVFWMGDGTGNVGNGFTKHCKRTVVKCFDSYSSKQRKMV